MNNTEVQEILLSCQEELESIKALLVGLGDGALPSGYVKKYAVIRATGSIEVSFKQIIADKVDEDSHIQVKNFIKRKVRDSSLNPKLGAIESILQEFDDRWRRKFDELLALEDKPLLSSALKKLVDARNTFAHGGDPELDIDLIISCFNHGQKVMSILDETVNFDFEDL